MTAYYNDNDPYCAGWLRNLIAAGIIPAGDVDDRSIKDVSPDDVRGYDQVHFFAGLGGWAYALRLASWPDSAPIWTGSCPCQPFSNAGKRGGFDDARHLWPDWHRIIRERRPAMVFGEQVASAKLWIDGVCADVEGDDYAIGAAVLPACCVNAPHKRERLWFVANDNDQRQQQSQGAEQQIGRWLGDGGSLGDAGSAGLSLSESQVLCGSRRWNEGRAVEQSGGPSELADADIIGRRPRGISDAAHDRAVAVADCEFWNEHEWVIGGDGKARRVKPGVRLLAHGIPARVPKLRALGNAIVPQVAAEFIQATREIYLQC